MPLVARNPDVRLGGQEDRLGGHKPRWPRAYHTGVSLGGHEDRLGGPRSRSRRPSLGGQEDGVDGPNPKRNTVSHRLDDRRDIRQGRADERLD